MNRKTALKRIVLLTTGLVAAAGGVKLYQAYKKPGLVNLDDYQKLIDELADVIIPRTNTPGAKDVGVGDFIINMVKDCCSRQNQNSFIQGLGDLEAYVKDKYNRTFVACTIDEKIAVMKYFQNKSKNNNGTIAKASRKVLGDPFFWILKKYTLIGYCTSLNGATMALQYDYVPGKYIGSIAIKNEQKGWATR